MGQRRLRNVRQLDKRVQHQDPHEKKMVPVSDAKQQRLATNQPINSRRRRVLSLSISLVLKAKRRRENTNKKLRKCDD